MRLILICFMALMMLVATILAPRAVRAQAILERVTIAYAKTEPRFNLLPLMIPYYDGYFRRQGLSIRIQAFDRDREAMDCVISGACDLAAVGGGQAAIAVERGFAATVIGALTIRSSLTGYTERPSITEISKPQDLANLSIGIEPLFSHSNDVMTRLEHLYGAKGELGLLKLRLKPLEEQDRLLRNGEVDIALANEPLLSRLIEQRGVKPVMPLYRLAPDSVLVGLIAARARLKQREAVMIKVLGAIQHGMTSLRTDPDQGSETLARIYPNEPPSRLRASLQRLRGYEIYPQTPVITKDLWQATLDRYLLQGSLFSPQKFEDAVTNLSPAPK
jgi:NitT/TauT family transport system substrate-binding protein